MAINIFNYKNNLNKTSYGGAMVTEHGGFNT